MRYDDVAPIAHELAKDVQEWDPVQIEAQLAMSAAPGSSDAMTAEQIAHTMNVVQLLKERAPAETASPAEYRTDSPRMQSFKRTLQAVVEPEALFTHVEKGRIPSETLEVWERLYPAALAELRTAVRADVRMHVARGGIYSRGQQRMISQLLGDQTLSSKLDSPQLVASLQNTLYASQEQPQRPRRAEGVDVAMSRMTKLQRLLEGRTA